MRCEDCDNEARFTFVWPWGQQGKVCDVHRVTSNQKSVQELDRGQLNFPPIDPNRPVELTRDERTQLRAGILARDDELNDLNARVGTLVKANSELVDEVRRLRSLNAHAEEELKAARDNTQRAIEARDKARADCGAAIVERDRLVLILRTAKP